MFLGVFSSGATVGNGRPRLSNRWSGSGDRCPARRAAVGGRRQGQGMGRESHGCARSRDGSKWTCRQINANPELGSANLFRFGWNYRCSARVPLARKAARFRPSCRALATRRHKVTRPGRRDRARGERPCERGRHRRPLRWRAEAMPQGTAPTSCMLARGGRAAGVWLRRGAPPGTHRRLQRCLTPAARSGCAEGRCVPPTDRCGVRYRRDAPRRSGALTRRSQTPPAPASLGGVRPARHLPRRLEAVAGQTARDWTARAM